MGSGHPGNTKGVNLPEYQLNEPGGLCYDSLNNRLYMADTNNCDIKVLDLEKKKVYSVSVLFEFVQCVYCVELVHVHLNIEAYRLKGIIPRTLNPNTSNVFSVQ